MELVDRYLIIKLHSQTPLLFRVSHLRYPNIRQHLISVTKSYHSRLQSLCLNSGVQVMSAKREKWQSTNPEKDSIVITPFNFLCMYHDAIILLQILPSALNEQRISLDAARALALLAFDTDYKHITSEEWNHPRREGTCHAFMVGLI